MLIVDRMNHKKKLKLARRLSGKAKDVFISKEWNKRKQAIIERVKKKESRYATD